MSNELPPGWASARIADITEHVSNAKPEDTPEKEFGYVDISAIDNSSFRITEVKRFKGKDAPSRARRPIQPNDILFSNVRTYLRNIALVEPGCAAQLCSTGFTVLRPNAAIQALYLFRYVLTKDFIDRVTPQQTGTHYPATSDRVVMAEEIALSPIAEQCRIVAKLEKLLGQVEGCQRRLAKIPLLLKRFRQSVLAAACSGRLTADWREGNPNTGDSSALIAELEQAHVVAGGHKLGNAAPPTDEAHDLNEDELPTTWRIIEMRTAVCPDRPITYGILKPGPDTPSGIPYVRVADFPGDRLNLATIRRTTKEIEQSYARARLREGDILLSIRGTVGRVCVVPRELQEANITQDTARLSIQPALNTDFVKWFLRAAPTQKRMQKAIKGVAVRGINIGDVRALQLPIPPLSEQQEIVRRVETLFALADQIEARYTEGQKRVDSITQSLLAKAFRGELVPTEFELAKAEGRSFESAEELLEKIGRNGEAKRRKANGNGTRLQGAPNKKAF